MKIASSRSDRKDGTAKVHISSLETPNLNDSQSILLNVDIAFRLETNPFPTPEGKLGHQLMLSVADVAPAVHESGFGIQHLVDLGVLSFSEQDPDFDEDVICRDDGDQNMWVATEELRGVFDTLVAEMTRYREARLQPPVVAESRCLRVAIDGMHYFNAFASPDLMEQSRIFFSSRGYSQDDESSSQFYLPVLFK